MVKFMGLVSLFNNLASYLSNELLGIMSFPYEDNLSVFVREMRHGETFGRSSWYYDGQALLTEKHK